MHRLARFVSIPSSFENESIYELDESLQGNRIPKECAGMPAPARFLLPELPIPYL